jgi:hypothetical protein
MQRSFGRIFKEDERDKSFPVANVISTSSLPNIPKKNWWADGWYGNQGSTSRCVVYSWSHWFEDGPVIENIILGRQKPIFDTGQFYIECQKRDGINEESYEGTTVRAGAKVLKELGIVKEYRWAFSIDEVIKAVTYLGPMVVGTMWYERMSNPSSKYIMTPRGNPLGGHAYMINGIDNNNELFRIKNSWGTRWAQHGQAYISFRNFEKLLLDHGEACIAFQNKISHVPSLDELTPVE